MKLPRVWDQAKARIPRGTTPRRDDAGRDLVELRLLPAKGMSEPALHLDRFFVTRNDDALAAAA